MGFTQGKRPSGAKIGKVHKIMSGNTVVFRDATSSLDDLIARAQENPVHLMLADVTIEEPGHPIEGENWRPQLAPYKPWVHDAALDETEELDGTDGDLLIVGALGMGISDEERMGIIGSAVRGEGGEGSTASMVGRSVEGAAEGAVSGGAATAVAPARKLLGIASLRTILLSDEDDIIEDIMETHVISVGTLEDKEDVAQTFSKYDFIALPVVDKEDRLVGIITVDDAMDVMEAEATEDIEKMAAMLPTDKPYLKTSVFETFKSRIPWLLLLMVSATFTGQIIAKFEDALGACAILTAYIPMLMDTGGNCGSQASVTVIRGISLDEIEFSDLLRVIWKEIRVAVLCAAVLSAANFVKLLLVDKMIFGNPITMTVAAVICLTLIVTVFAAKLVGCTLPLLAKKIGFDPAVMASPFITTVVDAISLAIYFRFAALLLGI